jgi:hypothetical protein
MGMSALGVGHGQPAHEGGEVAVLAGPQQQMEVVGHEAVGQQSHVEAGDGLLQDPLERGIVVIIVEESRSRISPVEGMVDQAAFGGTSRSWHILTVRRRKPDVKKGS